MHMPGLIPLLIVLFLAFLLFGRPGRLSSVSKRSRQVFIARVCPPWLQNQTK